MNQGTWGCIRNVLFGACLAWSCAHLDDSDCSATRTCPPMPGSAGQGGQAGASSDEAAAGAPRED